SPDVTPPRVVSLTPAAGSINKQNSVPVVIKFSEAIDTATLADNLLVFADTAQGGGSVVIMDGGSFLAVPNGERVDGIVTPSTDKLSATFTPTVTLADRITPGRFPADATITAVVLTRMKDLVGNNLDQDPTSAGQQLFSGSFATSQFNLTDTTSVARVNPQACRLEAALLPGDEVIVTGGYDQFNQVNSTADVYNRADGSFRSVTMIEPRAEHTTTVLDNGKVLITGGIGANGQVLSTAELYDPGTGSFTVAGSLNTPRFGHTATLLSDGTVLIAGGYNAAALDNCEIFIPAGNNLPYSNAFVQVPARMSAARAFHTATSLPGGYVLLAGGVSNARVLDTAEVFVPTPFAPQLGQFVSGSNPLAPWKMSSSRHHHTATALADGTVLIAGGRDHLGNALRTAEFFKSSTPIALSSFSSAGLMTGARTNHSATALSDGSVLIAGGISAAGAVLATAETYRNGQFTRTNSPLTDARSSHAAVLLPDGTVLVPNGENGIALKSAETFTKRH
ncbi:MAG: kelch repeat-containing protein, partial [Blastocatellia bacterium]